MASSPNDTADAPLTRTERSALALGRFFNERPGPKRLQHAVLTHLCANWIHLGVGRRIYVDGLAATLQLAPERGVLIAVNHRSFFDLWVTMMPLFIQRPLPSWLQRVCFPVRSNFFYERPLGMLVNHVTGLGCMYPPIFRDASKAALNDDAIARLKHFLAERGSAVGMHPEGTRGKGADPYQLLPAQPGIGQIVLHAKPLVIPVFINGLTNDFLLELRKTLVDCVQPQTDPVVLVFGAPVDYEDLLAQRPRLALYKRAADRIHEAIRGCADRERELRALMERGQLDDAPGWIVAKQQSKDRP